MRALLLTALALAGCREAADVPPLGEYTSWARFDVRGPAPGHGDDTYRIIYVNPQALEDPASHDNHFAEDSVVVKEIHDDDGGQAGALQYVAIMRRLGEPPSTLAETGGWTFTWGDEPGGDEYVNDACWSRCHVAAPYQGLWYDYRRAPAP